MKTVALFLALSACAGSMPPSEGAMAEASKPPVSACAPVRAAAPPPATAELVSQFRRAESRVKLILLRDDVSETAIDQISDQKDNAVRALRMLVAQDGHPTQEALSNAHAAVDALFKMLAENTPAPSLDANLPEK